MQYLRRLILCCVSAAKRMADLDPRVCIDDISNAHRASGFSQCGPDVAASTSRVVFMRAYF